MEKFRYCVSSWSVGQYETKLYHSKTESTSSSFVGGLMTLVAAILILGYTIYLLTITFTLKNRTIQESGKNVMSRGLVLGDFESSLLNSTFFVEYSPVPADVDCTKISLNVTLISQAEDDPT